MLVKHGAGKVLQVHDDPEKAKREAAKKATGKPAEPEKEPAPSEDPGASAPIR